jgi:hypothetical protein
MSVRLRLPTCDKRNASLLHDSQTAVSFVFPQERREDWEAEEPWDLFFARSGQET